MLQASKSFLQDSLMDEDDLLASCIARVVSAERHVDESGMCF